MKILIETQIRQNHGSEEEPYWKCKGGNTYLVSCPDDNSIDDEYVPPAVTKFVEESTPYYDEYILHSGVVDGDYVPTYGFIPLVYSSKTGNLVRAVSSVG